MIGMRAFNVNVYVYVYMYILVKRQQPAPNNGGNAYYYGGRGAPVSGPIGRRHRRRHMNQGPRSTSGEPALERAPSPPLMAAVEVNYMILIITHMCVLTFMLFTIINLMNNDTYLKWQN